MNLTVGVLVIPSRGTELTLNGVPVETDTTHYNNEVKALQIV